jgi:hypothetical protein
MRPGFLLRVGRALVAIHILWKLQSNPLLRLEMIVFI